MKQFRTEHEFINQVQPTFGTYHLYLHPKQVDVCHLGSLGPKALVGDIPALLGGVQPASVVAKTPLRVLQCRADKFAAHLDHNPRAKIGESSMENL